ncbi:S49 family peptidase [Parvibium lacunae]|uniref:S49 family peptidase n=1 Tax=Parvibium lacunae TaxID=1888893 RepID=A0A368L3Z5_9BURK|nr:S49 family peptidase [Parvibium lacunae]RCS58245.1 S49 family peptidase [Parvibium lacunae]
MWWKNIFNKSASQASPDIQQPGWERSVLERLALASIQEQRRARRWTIFFKVVGLLYAGVIIALLAGWEGFRHEAAKVGTHTALVNLQGEIAADSKASAENLNAALQSAFADSGTKGVILRCNSPGGSPVQSDLVNAEIKRLRAKYPAIPLYVVIEEVCASGGYFIAAAADKIFVNPASIVGSIGVLMDGYGFTGAMEKLGIERRLLTAGENKALLDPFSPVNPQQKEFVQTMLNDIHQQFINAVKAGRGKRLKDNPDIFSGLFWTGAKSIELGLADAVGSVESVAREVIKEDKVVDFSTEENIAERLAKRFGAAIGQGAAKTLFPTAAGGLR